MNVRRENADDGKGDDMTSWDPHQGRWVDDPPGRGSPWSRTTAVMVLAALLGGGAGFGAWTLSRDDGTTRTTSTDSATSTPSPSVSAAGPQDDGNTGPATPKQSDTDTDTDSDPGGAPGYVRSDDPAGFTVDVPSGWKRTAKTPKDKPAVVTYDSPDGSRILQLFLVSEGAPAESMDLAENENYGFARLPGYRVLDRSAPDDSYSEVVYRFDGEGDLGPRQVIDHRFRTADDKIYGVRLSAPESTPLDELREPVTMVVTSLCPSGATCVRG
ncbi:hypothetical protein [Streptomyces europaeiscabiei]|uniref:hypothetical protein n=1 Tax=Streptomyces europaeiscabiei TaxID=146819 RepID=UPI000E697CB0|nr:hypothetical protein [Streptomyces europaeiscabiei]MDX3708579.1 hypothetical protein [Streptomyces europaeiscabiei]MDX3834590.1 hypothetical protein [Streptomyces europaeiscabiei]MDX3842842.1 hypothetical protein [Streptomyces europaeiscabiei]